MIARGDGMIRFRWRFTQCEVRVNIVAERDRRVGLRLSIEGGVFADNILDESVEQFSAVFHRGVIISHKLHILTENFRKIKKKAAIKFQMSMELQVRYLTQRIKHLIKEFENIKSSHF
jgi:hypothetical protein